MGWGTHPDTISCAMASGAGNRSGHPWGTLAWMKAYREHYAQNNESFGGTLESYLASIDAEIALLEAAPKGTISKGFW
ncbi:hypothetical protein CcrColossus_gp388 [Caulobacter phage CcrColossus]|uniref:Uncharacterized protein n=1 Tax=Caulobacter phage CcrColossus TaxID=1211640 RepID=K4JWH3_9CAUD|nr:hypothetical protein CcrColossus_gp388 [Caulobacter phage CcrColossus]AFU88258.1 hypothetical protein CcrColossus_gp388 [Caulobacter phage CcrColossus]